MPPKSSFLFSNIHADYYRTPAAIYNTNKYFSTESITPFPVINVNSDYESQEIYGVPLKQTLIRNTKHCKELMESGTLLKKSVEKVFSIMFVNQY